MTTTQIVIVAVTVVVVVAIITGRKLTVTFKDVKATVERTERNVGEKNGNGALTDMSAKTLGHLAELDRKVENIDIRLEERTHITREGSTEPEDLGPYAQQRLHDILGSLARLETMVVLLWRALQADYDLPELPSLTEPKEHP